MKYSGEVAKDRRRTNAKALAKFGVVVDEKNIDPRFRTVRSGNGSTLFTIGYERRDGEELVGLLLEAGVDILADVREKPLSRKPDFRRSALEARCEDAGIEYHGWPELGSPEDDRKRLRETGDIDAFRRQFRSYAKRHLTEPLDRLAKVANTRTVALLCYERSHDDCHRSDVADLIADRVNATIVAIM